MQRWYLRVRSHLAKEIGGDLFAERTYLLRDLLDLEFEFRVRVGLVVLTAESLRVDVAEGCVEGCSRGFGGMSAFENLGNKSLRVAN
jgi:hypothetical protein